MKTHKYVLALALLTVAGCSDYQPPLPTDVRPAASMARSGTVAHEQLLHFLALALRDESVRSALHEALATSPVAEGKLHFLSYLDTSGGPLLAEMVRVSGLTDERLLQLVAEVRPLELYMPVPRHRRTWTGGDDLIVAGALREDHALIGVAPHGGRVVLSGTAPPETPVLALVPVESFDARGQPYRWSGRRPSQPSRHDFELQTQEGETCDPETAIDPCPDSGGGVSGGGGWSTPSNAVFTRGIGVREIASHLRTYNDHEPWVKGAPEYRLIIVGNSNLDSAAELRNVIVVPEGGWDGSDDAGNAQWRLFDPLPLVDWDTDYGNRVRLACVESDGGGSFTLNVSGQTTIVGATVDFSANFQFQDEDDVCEGQFDLLVRQSTGAWTRIPDARKRDSAYPEFDGPSTELQWIGYGIQL